jgi:hypothetical protein
MFEFPRKVEPLDLAIEAPTQPGPFVFRVKAVSGCGSTSPDIDVPHGWAAILSRTNWVSRRSSLKLRPAP